MAAEWKSGDAVAVTTPWGEQLSALVYAHDAANALLVLQVLTKREEVEWRVLSVAEDSGVAVSAAPGTLSHTRLATLPDFNEDHARQREQAAIAKLKAAALKIGKGVTREAQVLFNAIDLIYPQTRWEGTDIVVLGEVVVRAPYRVQDVRLVKEGAPTPLLRIVQSIVEKNVNKTNATA